MFTVIALAVFLRREGRGRERQALNFFPFLKQATAMRVGTLLLIALLPATSYAYTEGWQPGKAYTKYLTSSSSATAGADSSIPTAAADPSQYYKPAAVAKPALISSFDDLKRLFSLEEILTKGPISRIAQRFGFNVTAQLEMAREGIPPRFSLDIPLLTDANYEEDLLNEQYASPEEEDERVWAIMWCVLFIVVVGRR